MTKALTIVLPEDVVKRYELGLISQGKAAELAGLSRAVFIEALAEYGVSAVQTTPDDLESDVRVALGEKA